MEWDDNCPKCPPTCDNPYPIGECVRQTEAKYCCPKNKLLNSKGKCVSIQDCDCSDKYAVFVVNIPWGITSLNNLVLRKSGCVCTNGTIYDEFSKKCVPACNQCKCRLYSSYNPCGPTCEPKCGDRDVDKICDKKCNAGCFCNPGYIRADDGRCITNEECSRRFEIWDPCAHKVEPTCEKPNRCLANWTCIEGYVRNKNNMCVCKEECHN